MLSNGNFANFQEESLKQKGEEEYKIEVEKEEKDGELNKMSDEERYEKLHELLNQSKQYSDWLKTKMEQSEKERAKELQARKEEEKVTIFTIIRKHLVPTAGPPLERVRRVRPHPLKSGNGCAAPVLRT